MMPRFIIPLVVAFFFCVSGMAHAKELHMGFTALLSAHVKDGVVDYRSLKNDARLAQYCEQLAQIDPALLPSDKARLAFWLNVYNAYTLKIICEHYPIKSINDLSFGGLYLGTAFKKTVWDKPFVIVNKKTMTLNAVEHAIIRPVFKDPRVHFALVCGAKSCPPLRSEAYEEDSLDAQLDEQGRRFLSDPSKNAFDLSKRTARISRILNWFRKDFGETLAGRLLLLSRFLPEDIAKGIQSGPEAWKVRYQSYDWSLNE